MKLHALVLSFLLVLLLCGVTQAVYIEQFGFDTSVDGWEISSDATLQGVTNVLLSENGAGVVKEGAQSLEIQMKLSTNGHSQGRIIVDLSTDPAFAIDTPADLDGVQVVRNFRWNSNQTATARRYRWFAGDSSDRYTYEQWNTISNYAYSSGYRFTITDTNANTDSGFDATQIEIIGMDFALATGSTTQEYEGTAFIDYIRFAADPGAFEAPSDQKYSFDSDAESFQIQTWWDSQACTNITQSSTAPSNSTGCLAVDVHLDFDTTNYTKGEVYLDMNNNPPPDIDVPVDLDGKRVSAWFYCPAGMYGVSSNRNFLQIFCKDSSWRSFYGTPEHITEGQWFQVSMTPETNQAVEGYKDSGFDASQVRMLGVKVGLGDDSGNTYDGKMYIDGLRFAVLADEIDTNNTQYGFEPNKQGWTYDTYTDPVDYHGSLTGIVAVAQSTNYHVEVSNSLQLSCGFICEGTNTQKGAAKVDMVWFPPPTIRGPFDLDGVGIDAYVYCPAGSASTNAGYQNTVKLYVKDTNYFAEIGATAVIQDDRWVKVSLAPATNAPTGGHMDAGFSPAEVVELGLMVEMGGTYTDVLYLDHVAFEYEPPSVYGTSQHLYDFETESQSDWWQWSENPGGWDAKAWEDVYYATNAGRDDSVALSADGDFRLGVDEVVTNQSGVVSTNYDVGRKAVFEIAYQPALNLSTKDHRVVQASLRFVPAVEGLLSFDATINLFDKGTDQWYFKDFKVGGSSWNILEFDLDAAADYADTSPAGPMSTEAIGFATIQIYANAGWTGTVYLEDVVLGGEESGASYTPITSAFVKSEHHKFTIGGTNFYHCGANIEYLQTVPDSIVKDCLGWAQSNGIKVVRTWAMQEGQDYSFQPERGVWNELMFEHLDRIVAEAGDRDIRLMLGLCDNWAHNGGIFQYVHWVNKEYPGSVDTNLNKEGVLYHDQFWTNAYCRQWYKDYVSRLLYRTNTITGVVYKDDPTIFGWEIINEPRCESDFSGAKIHDWLHTMSDWVRTIDTNHILSGGEEGGYVNTYEFADTIPWEVYPDNYYHYGVYGSGSESCDLYGCGRGHGVDFISDNSSVSNYVIWQDGSYSNEAYHVPEGEWRSGNSNLNFATCRIYVDQKEYNVWRTNFNDADQRIEWLNDHWYDAHTVIGKPMILEEFGIHANGWVFNGSYGQVQLTRSPAYTQDDRKNVYELFYQYVENVGMPGSYFWNYGYEGMWNDPFHTCDAVEPWYANDGDGSATNVAIWTNDVIQGTNALVLQYDVPSTNQNKAIFVCPTNEMWVLRVDANSTNEPPTVGVNRGKFFWNVYNPGADITCAIALRGTESNFWCEAPQASLTGGWNKVLFDLSADYWAWEGNGWQHEDYLIHITNSVTGTNVLENVREVDFIVYNLPLGEGEVYIDDIEIKRDDGFVVYADDPVNVTISNHAARMEARNLATNNPANNRPVVTSRTITADAFVATNINLSGTDLDGDFLSYRILERPTNGWGFGIPPTNFIYKSKPGNEDVDQFTFVAHDGMMDSYVATITVAVGSTDIDNDSIPDSYEFEQFPKIVQWWPYESDSLTNLYTDADYDGDGFSDYREWYAGTDVTNGGSYLYVVGTNFTVGDEIIIEWPSVAGRTYELQRSTNLVVGFDTVLGSSLSATPPMNMFTDTTATADGPYIYRVEVE